MRKSIVALAASTLLVGMTISAIPAFADDAPAASGESSSAPAKHHMKSHKHSKKAKKSAESSSAAPESAPK